MFSPINYALAKKHWSKAYGDLKILEIGSRNYIILDKLSSYTPFNTTPTFSGNTVTTTYTRSGHDGSTNTILTLSIDGFTPSNKTYTVSGYVTVNDVIPAFDVWNGSSSLASTYGSNQTKNEFDEATGRFVITQEYDGSNSSIFNRFTYLSTGDVIDIEELKFEQGNKTTPWMPAPEDINANPFVAEMAETSYLSEANEKRIKELENAVATLGGTT